MLNLCGNGISEKVCVHNFDKFLSAYSKQERLISASVKYMYLNKVIDQLTRLELPICSHSYITTSNVMSSTHETTLSTTCIL